MPRPALMVFLFFLCGCPRPPPISAPTKPLAPREARIPPGCDVALTGDWHHQEDPSFRYHFEDDSDDVTIWVYRVFSAFDASTGGPDAGAVPLAAAVIHLRRAPNGFVGEAELLHLLPSGRECRATFGTVITACTPSTLTLSSAASTPVGEGCQTPFLPQPAAMLEHRLTRTDAGAL